MKITEAIIGFKILLVYSISIWVLPSCSTTENKTINKKTTTPEQTSSNEELVDTTNVSYTQLPFAGNVIRDKNLKTLPQIDSVIYLPLNTNFDFNFKNRGQLKYLKTFNHRLPNINKYEVYYSEFNCYENQDSILASICSNFVGLSCGFIMFYDSSLKTASIINLYNSYYIDSGIDMNFVIDKDYKINLTETGMTDGDVEPDEPMVSESYALSMHLIEVDTNGVIVIEEIR